MEQGDNPGKDPLFDLRPLSPTPTMVTPPAKSPPPDEAPQAQRPTTGGRMPSLNQLAARININVGANGTANNAAAPAARPRLAASLLRTGSTTSLSTVASTADSMAVNAPSTRSASPSTVSGASSPPASITHSIPEDGPLVGDPLTSEKLERLNQETERKVKVGYKNIPSLDAITQRLAKARSLSVDGSAKPPEAELIEDPKTPGVPMKAPEHPLQYPW